MPRLVTLKASILLTLLAGFPYFAAGQTQGVFQAAVNFSAGPPAVPSNTGFLFGGISPIDARTRDANGNILDFNGDGKPDLVVAANCNNYPGCTSSGAAIVVYLGKGDGTFSQAKVNAVPVSSMRSFAVGDFDGDGKIDVVVAADCISTQDCTSGSMIVLRGNGDGTLTAGATYPLGGFLVSAGTITVGDLNRDGNLDIVVGLGCIAGCAQGAVLVFLGNGNGTFQLTSTQTTTGNSGIPVLVADFTGDGNPDVLALTLYGPGGTTSNSGLVLFSGDGNGNVGNGVTTLLPYGAQMMAAGDLNGDGCLDVVVSMVATFETLNGDCKGSFQSPVTYLEALNNYLTDGAPVIVADVNNDGKPDVIVSESLFSFNGAQVFVNDGTGNLTAGATYSAGGWLWAPVDVADVNGDGKTDLVLVSGCAEDPSTGGQLCPDGTLTVFLGNGDGSFRSAKYMPGGRNNIGYSISVAAADFNGDGFQDLVFPGCALGSPCTGEGFTLLLADGAGGYQTPLFFQSPVTEAMQLAVADFNRDGKPDVALFNSCDQNCTGESVTIFLNTGSGTFSDPVVYESGGTSMAALTITTGDFNGDGKPDLALLHCCTSGGQNMIAILLGNGDGTFKQAATNNVADGSGSWIAAADFNGDGKADIVLAENPYNPNSGDPNATVVQTLISNGDGTFTAGENYNSGGERPSACCAIGGSVATGDVDGNGTPDIVVANVCDQTPNDAGDVNCARGAIEVLIGDGHGNFQPAVGQSPNPTVVPDANFLGISLADVNGDGRLDVIASTLTGVYVAFGNGDGTFQPGTVYAGLRVDQIVQPAVADLNGDGALDIVQPGDNAQLAILYNQVTKNSSAATTTNISAPAITYGASANVTVSVTSTQGTVTGNVSLSVDNGGPTIQALVNGSTTFTVNGLTGGTHSLSASYSAQGNFLASSSTGSLQVNQAQPTVSFTGAPASAGYHSTFSVAATTNASTTATITASGACSISGTTVTMTSGTGTCKLNASWLADSNYLAASANQSANAMTASSTSKVTANTPNPSLIGQTVTVSYTVTSALGTPTGNVTVSDGTGDSCTATVAAGKCSLSPLSAGTKTLTASYAGDANFSSSVSVGVSETVNKANTSTTIASQAPNPSVPGQPVMFSFKVAPVSPAGGTPTGTVTVSDGLGDSCTGTLALGYCLVSFAAAGSKSVTASYGGDSNFNASSSSAVTHNVIDFTLSVSPTSQSVKAGQKAMFTITVIPINGFTGAVKLDCTQFSQNSTCGVQTSPLVLTSPKSMSTKVTIQTSRTTAPNTYPLVFNGTLGNGVPQAGGILHYAGEYPNLILLTVN